MVADDAGVDQVDLEPLRSRIARYRSHCNQDAHRDEPIGRVDDEPRTTAA